MEVHILFSGGPENIVEGVFSEYGKAMDLKERMLKVGWDEKDLTIETFTVDQV